MSLVAGSHGANGGPDAAGDARAARIVNRFTVDVRVDDRGWSVAIVRPGGGDASVRACRDEAEARTYASAVRQHVGWLSEPTFRSYYRLSDEE